jgi:acyl-coenzyme A synthetase/AMP-(fatty) acid ligase
VRGELWVGGAGLARGYLNRAALTAERFVPDGHSEGEGERVYRTGDIGRYTSRGEIEYLGRLDEQVKIRGYRIEPGEVEGVLREHPAIQECVVVARETGEEKRLVSYLVVKEGKRVGARELRRHMSERVPEYMIPGAYVMVESLPLTANGKIDRRALPDEKSAGTETESRYLEPRTVVEEVIAGYGRRCLG